MATTFTLTHMDRGDGRKRIYARPERVVKQIQKVRRVLGYPKRVTCKVCYKKIWIEEADLVGGGGNQGHRDFFMCKSHR